MGLAKRKVAVIMGLAFALGAQGSCVGYRRALGVRKSARETSKLEQSPQWDQKREVFANPQPMWTNISVRSMIRAQRSKSPFASPAHPDRELRQYQLDAQELGKSPRSGLRVTWFGHSSIYLEVDGKRFLIDPVWGPSSPFKRIGPQRWIAPSIALEQLPVPDAVVLSHDHYDHLDHRSIERIKHWDTLFVVPLGVGQHLAYWGVEASKIIELDWWQTHDLDGFALVCTPARHASGRGLFDRDATLWSGWAFQGPDHRVYYSGDTGLFDDLKRIGEKLGPFDLSMIEVGQYHPNWPDWHLGPEQAVLAHQWVQGKTLLPVHWGAFNLAMHSWTAPIERTQVAAKKAGVKMSTPRLSRPTEPTLEGSSPWWTPGIPYKSAKEQPIIANDANGRPPRKDE